MAGIEKKLLEFMFDIEEIQYNYIGEFYLKISVQSPEHTAQYSKIHVRTNESIYIKNYFGVTDTVFQDETKKFYQLQDHKFTFVLPRGLCKNDKRHDVFLLVEAYEKFDDPSRNDKRVGEAKFGIYPRTNNPRVNLYVVPEADMYRTTDVMTLLRTLSTENINMHCGRLKFTASFRQILRAPKEMSAFEPPEDTPRTMTPPPSPPSPEPVPPPPRREIRHSPTPLPDRLTLPRTPSPNMDFTRKVSESPTQYEDTEDGGDLMGALTSTSHVAPMGSEEVKIIIHGAINLPSLPGGSTPSPFCTVKTRSDEDEGYPAQAVTRASVQPTHCPVWEQQVVVSLDENTIVDEVLVFNIADRRTKEVLTSYRLPVAHLHPFHQYHLEMVMPHRGVNEGIRLFATLMRKSSTLPRDLSSPSYVGLEVLLRSVERRLVNSIGPLIAVARIVPDFYTYRNDMLSGAVRSAGITMTTVMFPSPHPALFTIPQMQSQGYPQVSLPGKPPEQPLWNHAYFFSHKRDKATLFTPGAALVIELYGATEAMSDMTWRVRSPVGFSSLLLDQQTYRQLSAQGGHMGLRVQALPIQNTVLTTVSKKMPTLGLILRLLTDERPHMTGSVGDPEILPVLDTMQPLERPEFYTTHDRPTLTTDSSSYSSDESSSPPFGTFRYTRRAKTILPIKDGEMPPHDALETILPEYKYIFAEPDKKRVPYAPGQYISNGISRPPDGLDASSTSLLEYQMRELEKYRTAVQRMGQDIVSLRQQISNLEDTNSKLRHDLSNYNDATRLLMDSQELDGLTKPELAARYVAIKQRFSQQTNQLRDYKSRVQQLQNDLIRKNDQEKHMLKMGHAHQSQNELVQKLQDKAQKTRKLEETCRNQERVIQRMEQLMQKSQPGKKGFDDESSKNARNEMLLAENKRLREELTESKDQQRYIASTPVDDTDKLQLYEKLDKADSRIISLEKQLAENARRWGRDKSDMMTRLQEAEHGFRRNSPLDRDFPFIDTRQNDTESRRYSKDPRKGRRASPKLDPLRHH